MNDFDFAVFLCPKVNALPREVRLADAAARYTGREDDWTLARTDAGKPYFLHVPDVCFSISHSGDYWACAFGRIPLGLDLQQHVPCQIARISRRFFHPEEYTWLEAHAYNPADFFSLWTAKESFAKYTGTGIAAGLDNFSVVPPGPDGAQLRQLPAPDGYSLCLCAARIEAVRIINVDDGDVERNME